MIGHDVGAPALRGSTTAVNGGWNLVGGGDDIWDRADQFHFAHERRSGDFSLTARVESLDEGHLYTKAGLMARATLDAGSPHVFHLVFPTNAARNNNSGGVEAQVRDEAAGPSRAYYPPLKSVGAPEFPVTFPHVWLRLERRADHWSCDVSSDGLLWSNYSAFDLALPDELEVGLAVTSHNGSRTVAAQFRDLTWD